MLSKVVLNTFGTQKVLNSSLVEQNVLYGYKNYRSFTATIGLATFGIGQARLASLCFLFSAICGLKVSQLSIIDISQDISLFSFFYPHLNMTASGFADVRLSLCSSIQSPICFIIFRICFIHEHILALGFHNWR